MTLPLDLSKQPQHEDSSDFMSCVGVRRTATHCSPVARPVMESGATRMAVQLLEKDLRDDMDTKLDLLQKNVCRSFERQFLALGLQVHNLRAEVSSLQVVTTGMIGHEEGEEGAPAATETKMGRGAMR